MSPNTHTPRKITIIGGGAAGFFAAITAAEADPSAEVTVYEKGNAFLTKVKIPAFYPPQHRCHHA